MNANALDEESDESISDQESFLNGLLDFAHEAAKRSPPVERRLECNRCRRPVTVCWCPFLPEKPIVTDTTVYILQHPLEEQRKLRTAPMLYHSLASGGCHIIKGRKFSPKRNPELADVFASEHTVLLFPGPDATDIRSLPRVDSGYNLVVLDGTWTQAKGMYINNSAIKKLKKVQINQECKSKYLIRTQPTDDSLSTVESAAIAVSILEDKPQLADVLTQPLEALVNFQLKHGAVQHQSKEQRIADGTWEKQLPQKLLKQRQKHQENTVTEDSGS